MSRRAQEGSTVIATIPICQRRGSRKIATSSCASFKLGLPREPAALVALREASAPLLAHLAQLPMS